MMEGDSMEFEDGLLTVGDVWGYYPDPWVESSGEGDGDVGWDQALGFLCVSNSFTENWWSLSLLMRQVGGPNFVLQLIQITKRY